MRAMIHQNQLTVRYRTQVVTAQEQDFISWLEQHVGELGRDWGRTYNIDTGSPEFGTTWWFRDPARATLTLLRWS